MRQQLAVLRRASSRPQLEDHDRLFWIALKRIWSEWDGVLQLAQPATLIKWHRAGFRFYWRRKSRPKGGRPRIDPQLRRPIRDMWSANPTRGKRRFQAELAKLGISGSDPTVARSKPMRHTPPSQQSRAHRSLDNDCPLPRQIELPPMGEVITFPKVGGLHHRCSRRLAA